MAVQPQPVGGLGAMARPPAPPAAPGAPPPKPPSEAADAARVSGMEQEKIESPQDRMDNAIEKQRQARAALSAQMKLLQDSFDTRMNLPFDTSLMSAAAGFLKPTKTGSFGESLGYAAENYAADAEKALLRQQQAAKAKLELAQQQQSMENKNLEFEHLLQMAGYDPSKATTLTGGAGAPSPTAIPTAAPVTQAPGEAGRVAPPAVAGAPIARPAGSVGQTGASNQMKLISDADIATAYAISKEHGAEIANLAKMQREDIISTPEGPFSRSQQKYLNVDAFNAVPKEYDFGPAGSRKTTPDVFRQYQEIIKSGDDDKLRDFFISQRWLAGKPSGAPSTGVPAQAGAKPSGAAPQSGGLGLPTRFKTEEEKNQEKITLGAQEAEAKKYAEGAGDMATNLRESALSASDVKGLAEEAGSISKAAPNAFKLLMNKDSPLRTSFDGYLQAVKTGAQTPWGSFSIPVDVIEKNRLTDTEIQALQKYAQIEAQFTLFNRRLWLKGQGAISNGENSVAAQLGPQATDRPEVIQMKAQAISRKADFDEQSFTAFEDWREKNTGGFSKFLVSPEFKAIKDEYLGDLKAMRESNARHFSGEKKPAATAPATPSASPSANETPLDRFKRAKAELERKARGEQ